MMSRLRRQNGVVLLIALIVLVAMTLAGIALVRSVYTTNLIAANMAFRQAATNSADIGIETAVQWLESQSGGAVLHQNVPTEGYAAFQSDPDPVTHQSWNSFWSGLVSANQVLQIKDPTTGAPIRDVAGNTISYAIQRLCLTVGAPMAAGVNCAQSPPSSVMNSGGSKGAGVIQLSLNSQVYYRITVQVNGPRNTVSYVQAVVAL